MIFEKNNIEIIYNEKSMIEPISQSLEPIFKIAKKTNVKIIEIELEDNSNGYIYIEKQENNPDEWDENTLNFAKLINDCLDINTMLADEDYGPTVDMVIIYNDENGIVRC